MYSDSDSDSSRPRTPLEEDCCHNACDPCIFDIHKKLLEEYEKKKKHSIKSNVNKNVLCLTSYRSFFVREVQETSESYILLSLTCQENGTKRDTKLLIKPGQYVMLHVGDMTRPYTPISWSKNRINFLIKLYPNGKFSTYVKSLKVNDKIDVRGPYGDFEYKCNSFQQIIMFSIGSGIAAIYPIAKYITDDELEETKICLIGGFQNILQIPLRKELQSLSDYWNFKCMLYLSQPLSNVSNIHGIDIENGRLDRQSVTEILQNYVPDTTLILICGTEKFNTCVEQWARDMNYSHLHIFK